MFDIDMITDGMELFFKGKLFLDYTMVFRQALLGMAIAAFTLVCLVKLGVPMTISVLVAAIFGGMLQPLLLKDIKFK